MKTLEARFDTTEMSKELRGAYGEAWECFSWSMKLWTTLKMRDDEVGAGALSVLRPTLGEMQGKLLLWEGGFL